MLYLHPDDSLSPDCQRGGRAVSPPVEGWTDHLPLVLLGMRPFLKPELDCSADELVFGVTVRLPGEMISPTPRGAVEDSTNLLHRCRQFVRALSPVPPRSPPLFLILRRTWQHALTSTFDVVESAALWNSPMTAHSGCSPAGRRCSTSNTTIKRSSFV
ncbi:hypothetical protein SprV_0100413300 [Sparganum proliferum]